MSAGMDALTVAHLLADGRPRTHRELFIATGLTGPRMRAAIAILARDGIIAPVRVSEYLGKRRGEHVIQCWQSTGVQP